MHSKSDHIEIMFQDKGDEVIKKNLYHFLINTKLGWKNQ